MFVLAMDRTGPPGIRGGGRGGPVAAGGSAMSPESAMASELFDQMVAAGTFKAVLHLYRQICELLRLHPTNLPAFYPRLKAKLKSWKATNLWNKLDKRASHKCYNRGKACPNSRVLVIGAGPCGLRAAIEAQLLGAKVVVLEKRDRFSRNNVLHLWPFVIHDLRNLGAKKFFGKFCAGSIDHISIRQLQLILLKVALLLGVEVHENVTFQQLLEPPLDQTHEKVGWRAQITPSDHPVAQYEFDVLIGADGKRNTLLGFNRKEFRGKLAIAVTANFINRQSMEEASVAEISGVAFIFNQKFFQDMKEQTGVDLENIVYYKDDTHYFVMTAKKQSLMDHGVIINDFSDTARLLSPDNVDRQRLMAYARAAADFATNGQMPHLDFAVNHYGQADVAMFDFTSMYAAENACRMVERRGHRLLQSLVGDCLLEPFWPTGSGCARGFLSALDTAWMVRSWSSGKMTPLQVLAEREACYRLLAQTTPENLHKDLNVYSLSPASRYPNLNLLAVLPSQVRCLCDTDTEIQDQLPDVVPEMLRKKRRRMSLIHPDALLSWCQRQVCLTEGIEIENLSTSWKSGLALCAILNRYRPDLVDVRSLNPQDSARNNQLAFDICEREFGIPPIMTGIDMAECEVPDKLAMVAYVTQIYDTFRGEIPYLVRPAKNTPEEPLVEVNQQTATPTSRNILTKIGHKLHPRKRYSVEREAHREGGEGGKRTKTPSSLSNRRRSRDKDKGISQNPDAKDVALTGYRKIPHQPLHRDQFRMRMKCLQKQLRKDEGRRSGESQEEEEDEGLFPMSSKPSLIGKIAPEDWNVRMLEEKIKMHGKVDAKRQPKVGRLRKDEWNLQLLEEKIRQQQMGPPEKEFPVERPKVLQEIFKDKLTDMNAKLKADGGMTQDEVAKYGQFDNKVRQLEQQLHEGNMDSGPRGKNRVARMAQHMATILDWDAGVKGEKQPPAPPPPILTPAKEPIILPVRVAVNASSGGRSESCCFCHKRVYLMERLSAEGLFFHRSCFRCEYCGANLRLGHYAFDRSSASAVRVFCPPHLNLQKTTASIQKDQRFAEMMKRKHAFLSGSSLDQAPSLAPSSPTMPSSPQRASPIQKGSLQPDVTLDGAITVTPVNPAVATLSAPTGLDNRDRTPERVEFENTLLELSEDELLTSELEEEELTQKNFGPSHELTSDDEYSDLSTDTESDEDYLIEELEKSFTADGTRKLAETWQQKHQNKQSPADGQIKVTTPVTPGSRGPGERSGGSTTPEADGKEDEEDEEETDDSQESDTETGGDDDTSDDIETDEEYASDEQKVVEPAEEAVSCDIVMQVPILQPRTIPEDSEEFTMSEEESDDLLEVDGGEERDGSTQEETTSEEEEEPLPPHQIPLIVINESPPQLETDKDWAEEMASTLLQENALLEEQIQPSQDSQSPLPEPLVDDGVLLLATLEKVSTSSSGSSLLTSPEGSSQTTTSTTTTTTQEITASTSNELKALCREELSLEDREEIRETAQFLVDDLMLKATASLSSSDSPKEQVVPQLDLNGLVEQAKIVKDEEDTFPPECVKDSLNLDNIEPKLPSVIVGPKWEEIGKNLPPLVLSVPLAATRNSMDKFRFIAGVPSPQPQYSPSKTSASPKELASKLFEFHRKIEELQKQLPSPPVSSPPVSASRPDFWKTRGASPPVLECEAYYQSLQHKIKVPETTSAVPLESKLLSEDCHKMEDSSMKDLSVVDVSIATVNKLVPKDVAQPICRESTSLDSNLNVEDHINEASVKVLVVPTPPNALDIASSARSNTVEEPLQSVLDSSDEWMGNIENTKPSTIKIQNDLNDELIELSKKYSFNPAYITLRKHNKLPPHFSPRDDETSSVENLLDLGKYKRPLPKPIGLLSNVLTNSQPELSPASKRLVSDSTLSPLIMSSSLEKRLPESVSPSKGDVRFQGYRGSFADKVRPRSLVGDSIYLKSLSINLQKLAFPSLTKDSSFGGSCGTLKDEDIIKTPCKKLPLASKSIEDILMGSPEDDKEVYPTGKEQLKDGSLPTTKKEKHDRMLFADDEKQSLAGGSILGSVEYINNSLPDYIYLTPPNTSCKDPRKETEDERLIRLQRTVEQERARQEARERARMKSDEELGLSPCNYRKRYIQASSLSLGNYDELSSDDFLDDKDDMYEDDSDNEMDGVFHERRVAFSERIQSVEPANDCIPSPNWAQETSPESGNATSSEKTLTTSSCSKTDPANYMESSLSPEDFLSPETTKPPTMLLCPTKLSMSSTESSPGTPDSPPIRGKTKGKLKFQLDRKPEEEKVKSNGKKSFLSLLHFGRNSSSPKEKSSKNKSRSSSLPPDIRGRSKERSFALLKFAKGRDRSRDKQKKKSNAPEDIVEGPSRLPQPELGVVLRPKSASEPPEVRPCPPILKTSSVPHTEIVPLQAFPPSLKAAVQMENGLAPKASVDSFTDTEEEGSKHLSLGTDKKPKTHLPVTPTLPPAPGEKEQRLLRMAQRVHRKQELKRFRTGQEIERRLQEIDVRRKDLEQRGVHCEKALRGETNVSPSSKEDVDLMQEWFGLVRSRNKLEREEQELIIRMKDLELEERHSILQHEMRGRMAKSDDLKTKSEVEEERNILKEMLAIVEKRDELVLTLDQLKLREEVEDRDLENKMLASGIQMSPEANR